MRQFTTCSILFLFYTLNIFSQNSLDDLNIVFKQDFERNTLGTYLYNEWKADFLNPAWSNRQSELDIVQNPSDYTNKSKAMQINFPANSLGPEEGGTNWWTIFEKQDELYMSYDFKFMPGFQFQWGGKLPSIQAGELTSSGPTGYDGFTGGLMFNSAGDLTFYIYYPDSKTETYGETFLWGSNGYAPNYFSPSQVVYEYGSGKVSYCDPGYWHNITYRIVANTLQSEGVGNYDGILEAYFDGVLVTQISHFLFRKTANLGLNHIRMVSFFGGNTDQWRNPIEEWLQVDNIMLYTFKQGYNAPRGNTLSPRDRTINYWRRMITQAETLPIAPTNTSSNTVTTNSATITWKDNSDNEYGFEIYRSLSSDKDFVKIGNANANSTSFVSSSLAPNTIYYYNVKAYNGKGTSANSATISIKTLPLVLPPATPSGLIIKSQDDNNIVIAWNDISNDEYGFEIFRSTTETSGYTIVGTTPANTTEFVSSSIKPNTSYYYKVRSYNGNGNSEFSNIASVIAPPIEIPAPPSDLIIVYALHDSVMLHWIDNSEIEDGFVLEKSEGDSIHFLVLFTSGINQTLFTDFNINSNLNYYRVRSFNEGGYSAYSNIIEVKFEQIIDLPGKPLNLNLVSIGLDNATINWDDNSINETGFEVQRFGPNNRNLVTFFKTSVNITTITDRTLQPNSEYFYYVRAFNENGYSGYSNEIIAQTTVIDTPQAPSLVQTIEATQNSITLEWQDNSDNESAFYIKRTLLVDTNEVKIITLNANITSFTDTALKPNTDFQYQIYASNQAGNSTPSNKIVAATLSNTEIIRVKDGLIAYYNFHYFPDYVIKDLSGYKEPLNLQITDPNSVEWHSNNSMEILRSTSIVSTTPATKIIDAYKNSNQMTVECWIKPSEPSEQFNSRIVSLDADESDVGFMLTQNFSNLNSPASFNYSIRLHTNSTNESGFPEFSLKQGINYINLMHIVYIRDSLWQEKFYLNGSISDESYRPNNFEDWNDNYFLSFGNTSDQNSPWTGTFYMLALYDIALSDSQIFKNYLAGPTEDLVVYKNDYNIYVSPNPVKDFATIEIVPVEDQDIASQTVFRIIDMFGTKYHEEILFNPGDKYTKTFDFSNYPKGIYVINVLSDGKQQSTRFIVE